MPSECKYPQYLLHLRLLTNVQVAELQDFNIGLMSADVVACDIRNKFEGRVYANYWSECLTFPGET